MNLMEYKKDGTTTIINKKPNGDLELLTVFPTDFVNIVDFTEGQKQLILQDLMRAYGEADGDMRDDTFKGIFAEVYFGCFDEVVMRSLYEWIDPALLGSENGKVFH